MKDNNGVFTERLKLERVRKGITMKQMAEMLGYNSTSSYMYIEKGKVQPTIMVMNKISAFLGRPVQYFFKLNVQETQTKQGPWNYYGW